MYYPDDINVCAGIALISLFFSYYTVSIRRKYKYQSKIFINILQGLILVCFLLGTILNSIQIYLRYGIGYGPYQYLWHRGMDCYYISIGCAMLYLIVFLLGYLEFQVRIK